MGQQHKLQMIGTPRRLPFLNEFLKFHFVSKFSKFFSKKIFFFKIFIFSRNKFPLFSFLDGMKTELADVQKEVKQTNSSIFDEVLAQQHDMDLRLR